jgi:hypothetical protein
MKASDSTTSLDALNPPDPACFICLETEHPSEEPLVDSKLLRNCGCRFSVHPVCWNLWLQGKSDFDCPICRRESVKKINISPNPVLAHAVAYENESSGRRRTRRRECLILLISLSLFIIILLAISSKI